MKYSKYKNVPTAGSASVATKNESGAVPSRRGSISSNSGKGYYIRWSRIRKSVEVDDPTYNSGSTGGSKSSDAGVGTITKVILNDCSGSAAPGEVLALMGPSGSGKTSLLNCLSGRTHYNSGVLSVNGRPLKGDKSSSAMKRLKSKIAYVKQSDIFFTHLTVRDQLTYTAMLRLPEKMGKAEKVAEVNRILDMLRLSHVAESKIFLLSGGEKKRVNIGTELLTNPTCILLDEPTSGLDSTTSVSLIKTLQKLAADESKTIITSIHQPNSALFRSFDKLMMLAEGNVVYFGTPKHSISYLKDRHVPCPQGYNAADHWMDILVGDKKLSQGMEETLMMQMGQRDDEADDSGYGSLLEADFSNSAGIQEQMSLNGSGTVAMRSLAVGEFSDRSEQDESLSSAIDIDFDVEKFIAKAARKAGIEIKSAGKGGKINIRDESESSSSSSNNNINSSSGSSGSIDSKKALTIQLKPTEDSSKSSDDRSAAKNINVTKETHLTEPSVDTSEHPTSTMAKIFGSEVGFGSSDHSDSKTKDDLSIRQHLIDSWDGEMVAVRQDEAVEATMAIGTSEHSAIDGNGEVSDGENFEKYATSWLTQYKVLTSRALQYSKADIFTPLNIIKSAALGVIAGGLWWQTPYTESTVRDRSSYFFFLSTYWVFDSLFLALMSFPSERVIILKERSSASYHLSAYFMAKTTSDAPTRLALPIIFMIISFWMTGISDRIIVFLACTGVTLLSVIAGESAGLLIGAAFNDMKKAMAIAAVGTLSFMLLGGFFIENVPAYLQWVGYLSIFRYQFDAHRELIFDRDLPCDGSNALPELCEVNESGFVPSEELLEFLGIGQPLSFNIGILVALALVPRYMAFLVLRRQKETER